MPDDACPPGLLQRATRRLPFLRPASPVGRYHRDLALSFIAYTAVLLPATRIVDANPDADWRYAVAVLPMIPCGVVLLVWLRLFRRLDELEQRVALESLAFAFGATVLITFGYGFLQTAGLPDINWLFVWPVMGICWILGFCIARRRWF